MNKLTRTEFADRTRAINNAYRIFRELTDNNIENAFIAYQKILAEDEIPIHLNTADHGNRPRAKFDDFDRPKCPDCNSDLMFRPVPKNPDNIQVQLVCSNNSCDTVLNSENNMAWWMENMRLKGRDIHAE